MPLHKKFAAFTAAAVMTVSALSGSVSADEPYRGYNYNWWGDDIPSQNGYVVSDVFTGLDLGTTELNGPSDMFIDQTDKKLYIADSGNNRIVIADISEDGRFSGAKVMDTFKYGSEFPESESTIKVKTLNSPLGVFVTHYKDQTLIYIADSMNSRIIGCYEDGTIFHEYVKPSSDLYDSGKVFRPGKVVVDNALNVYVVITSITDGMVQFSQDGTFNGFYGANRVQTTAEVLQNAVLRLFMTREQMQKRSRSVAIEITNCDIDTKGFIYTVTGLTASRTDVLKKLNPAGENIYINMGYDGYIFGDYPTYYDGQTYASAIEDVDIDEDENVFLLDTKNKRVFQYSKELDLEFIFGGYGSQKGLFTSPTAIETFNKKVFVLDDQKNSITSFKLTEFGEIVQDAIEKFNRGLYEEAKGPFEEILQRDSNYWYAYIGLGNAYYTMGDNETAMKYFYQNSRGGYNRAFKEYRMDQIRKYFNVFMIGLILVIIAVIVLSKVIKIQKKKKQLNAAKGGEQDAV